MAKWTLKLALLLTLGLATGMAATINVDFGSLSPDSHDIGSTTAPNGWTIGNVRFLYDDFGDPDLNGTAQVSAGGIDVFAGTGGLGGALEFIFYPNSTPQILVYGQMNFQFSLGTATGPLEVADGAFSFLDNGIDSLLAPTDALGAGSVSFPSPGGPYSIATTFFSVDQSAFFANVSAVAYDEVPEPGTYALIASGLLLLGWGRRKLLKSRS